jgi:hypothetical protein
MYRWIYSPHKSFIFTSLKVPKIDVFENIMKAYAASRNG